MRRREFLQSSATVAGSVVGGSVLSPGDASPVRDEAAFTPVARESLRGTHEAVVTPDGTTAAVAVGDGYATVDLSEPTNPRVLAERRGLFDGRKNGPLVGVQDVKLDGETLAVVAPANAREEPVVHAAVLVDVSDPAAPRRLGSFETDYPIHNCAFADGTLYLTANGAAEETDPVVVVDASDPTAPTEIARWRLTDARPAWADTPDILRSAHDVWVRDGLAAVAFWDTGTHLLDVSDPARPTYLGTARAFTPEESATASSDQLVRPPGNHHYAATNADNTLLAVGKESKTFAGEGGPSGITLYDVSDPTDPEPRGEIPPPVPASPDSGDFWTTAHNFELRDGICYSSWYDGGVMRHDVSDPTDPTRRSWWADPGVQFWTARTVTDELFLAAAEGMGVYLFPDTAGTGGNLEPLHATPTRSDATATAATETTDDGETTETATPSDAVTPDGRGTAGSTTVADGETTTTTPGLGATTAVGAAGLAAWRFSRRARRDD